MAATAPKTKIIRQLRSGQITIPIEFRRELHLEDDGLLQVTLSDGELRLKPVHVSDTGKGSPWLKGLYEYFAPARQEILERGISAEEVNADIDAAIAEVRAEYRTKHR